MGRMGIFRVVGDSSPGTHTFFLRSPWRDIALHHFGSIPRLFIHSMVSRVRKEVSLMMFFWHFSPTFSRNLSADGILFFSSYLHFPSPELCLFLPLHFLDCSPFPLVFFSRIWPSRFFFFAWAVSRWNRLLSFVFAPFDFFPNWIPRSKSCVRFFSCNDLRLLGLRPAVRSGRTSRIFSLFFSSFVPI